MILCETRWVRLSSSSWKREAGLQRFHRAIYAYWAGVSIQPRSSGHHPGLRLRQDAALRQIHRERGEQFVTKVYDDFVPRDKVLPALSDFSTAGSKMLTCRTNQRTPVGGEELSTPWAPSAILSSFFALIT